MNIFTKITLVGAAVFAMFSCNKNSDTVEARILDAQDITNLGCGYLLLLEDSGLVKPDYLPSAFQHNGMKVQVKYQHTGVMDTCDYGAKIYDRASILKIQQIRDR
jgi:hypothetical protein